MSFFVLGLPRSRTAWLANFLTYDGLFCYHEGTGGCHSIDEYKDKIAGKGDSNTGLALFDFEPHFKDSKIVVIDSTIDRSVKFAADVFNVDVKDSMKALKNRLDNIEGLHIDIKDINNRLSDIWEFIANSPMDYERANSLINMNIQVCDPLKIDYAALNDFKGSINEYVA